MKRKLFILLTAFTLILSPSSFSLPVHAEEILYDEETIEETTTAVTETTAVSTTEINGITEEEFNEKNAAMQEQIDEIYRMFEENGYNIEGINGNVEGLSNDLSGLQMSLDELYSLINTLKTTSSSNSVSASPTASPKVTTPKKPPATVTTTSVTTAVVEPDTTPNGYLVEKAEKYPEERDFITVTTRDGHVFYLVIDYEDENKKVYFLNTVDTADLKRLLENGSTTAVTPAEKEESETKTEAVNADENAEKKETPKKKNSNILLYIIGAVMVAVFVFIGKKKLSGGKKKFKDDEDEETEDTTDDFSEEEPEIYIDEDNEE